MAEVQYTERLTMHLNGGSKFTELHYRIHADGEPTSIRHYRRTSGRPKYLVTLDTLYCEHCRAERDNLTSARAGVLVWLAEHARPHDPAPAGPHTSPTEES